MTKAEKYRYTISWSPTHKKFKGLCSEFPEVEAIGNTPDETLRTHIKVIQEKIDNLKTKGAYIPEPLSEREYTGKITLRMSREAHEHASIASSERGMSLNQYIVARTMEPSKR